MKNSTDKRSSIRAAHTILFELALITTLTAFIAIFRIGYSGWEGSEQVEREFIMAGQHNVIMEEGQHFTELEPVAPVLKKEEATPSPPPSPEIAARPPVDEIIEDMDFDDDLPAREAEYLPVPLRSTDEVFGRGRGYFTAVQEMPELKEALSTVYDRIRYPEEARREGLEGSVFLQFIVNEKGEVEDTEVLRGIGGGADEEAVRVVSQTQFRPGKMRGRPVRVKMGIGVKFEMRRITFIQMR
ncbi:MAG: TonB family protein [Balneolaceae bacterium]